MRFAQGSRGPTPPAAVSGGDGSAAIKLLEASLAEVKQERDDARDKLADAQQSLATQTGELDRALDDNAKLKAENDTHKDELNASNQKLTKATDRNKSAQAELGGLEVKAEMFEEQVVELSAQVQQLQAENQQIEQLQVCARLPVSPSPRLPVSPSPRVCPPRSVTWAFAAVA